MSKSFICTCTCRAHKTFKLQVPAHFMIRHLSIFLFWEYWRANSTGAQPCAQEISTKTYNHFCICKIVRRNSSFSKCCFIRHQHSAERICIILHMLQPRIFCNNFFCVGEVIVLVSKTGLCQHLPLHQQSFYQADQKWVLLQTYRQLFFLDESGGLYHKDQERKPVLLLMFFPLYNEHSSFPSIFIGRPSLTLASIGNISPS